MYCKMWSIINGEGSEMINQFSKNLYWLVLVIVFIGTGCEQNYKKEVGVAADQAKVETSVLIPDYASRAVQAAGTLDAWTGTKNIKLDGVVAFYRPDGSFYLSEQHYEIRPWSNSIRISAFEPQGKFVWQLSGDGFRVLEGAKRLNTLPVAVCKCYLAEALLDITVAPVLLLEDNTGFTKGLEPVRIEGLWYYPIEQVEGNGKFSLRCAKDKSLSKAVFYQSKDSSLIDMIWFAGVGEEKFLAIRGYDYREVEKGGVRIPAKIEIFKTNDKGVLQQRLVKVDFHSLIIRN
jgi:hypothetical protein